MKEDFAEMRILIISCFCENNLNFAKHNNKNTRMSIPYDKYKSSPPHNKSYHYSKIRERSESTCELICFRKCNEEPIKEEMHEGEMPQLKINKLSLKKSLY